MRTIEKGQKVVSRSGFVHTVVRVHKDREDRTWVVTESEASKARSHYSKTYQEHYLEKEFLARFGDQLPKEKPKQGELM